VTAEVWRDRVWAAHPDLLALGASGPSPARATWRRGPLTGADLGVPHPWGVQVTAGLTVPDGADAAAALAWCQGRGGDRGWAVSVPRSLATATPWKHLVVRESMGVYATDAATAATLDEQVPDGVELVLDPSLDDVVDGYGGWMGDLPLAALLVTAGDLARPDRRFVVARLDGRAVGSALVWWARGTGYLSGVGVVEDLRGHGIGRALTGRAARVAAQGHDGIPPDVVWMHATAEGSALYARMGFTLVDTEVQLGPR
jgi:GNAT superfamily N-acetyltransferase